MAKILIAPAEVRPVLCLDADGTIRRSKSGKQFIQGPDDIELMPGIEEKIWDFRNNGYLILVVSNQGGVAHGFKSTQQAEAEMDATIKLFKKNPFHGYKQCYHMADGKEYPYNHRSLFRKPCIGMLAEFESEAWKGGFIVDWDGSLFVGDREEDKQCALNAGIPYVDINIFLNQ